MPAHESLNIASNITYIIVAFALMQQFRRYRAFKMKYRFLLLTIIGIAAASTTYHIVHTPFALFLDNAAAYLFVGVFLLLALPRIGHIKQYIIPVALAMLAVIFVMKVAVPDKLFGVSTPHLAGVTIELILSSFLYFRYGRRSREVTFMWVFIATGLLFRTTSLHFIWHTLSALSVYAGVSLFVRREKNAAQKRVMMAWPAVG